MTPAEIIEHVAAAGLAIAISATGNIAVAGNRDGISRWSPLIREHKAGIIQTLQAGFGVADTPQAALRRPSAKAEPMRDKAGSETDELRQLVSLVTTDYPADEKVEALALAEADPDSALICYRILASERETQPLSRSSGVG